MAQTYLARKPKKKNSNLSGFERWDYVELTENVIPENSLIIGKQVVQLRFPNTTLISYIQRDKKYITLTGATILKGNDRLLILYENDDSLNKVFHCLGLSRNILESNT